MTVSQKRKTLIKIQKLQSELEQLEEVRTKLASSEYASATMSSGSGSKSYTRADLTKIQTVISALKSELRNCRKLLKGENQSLGTPIYVRYDISY